jgi:hypothetical protein
LCSYLYAVIIIIEVSNPQNLESESPSPSLDYKHGTGHGVGAHLNVHEGPHGAGALRTSVSPTSTILRTGLHEGRDDNDIQQKVMGLLILR